MQQSSVGVAVRVEVQVAVGVAVFVIMVMYVWWVEPVILKEEWRCVSALHGEQCVMTLGTAMMPWWFVISLDIHQ